MASVTQICNMALIPLGAPRILDIVTENSEQARRCNVIYEETRDQEQATHDWNFATVIASVVRTTTTPAYGYSYSYQTPSDFLRIKTNQYEDYPFKVVGQLIYSDESSLKIEYIKQVTDTSLFPPYFVELLVARIKYELAYSFTKSRTIAADCYEVYKETRRKARALDSQEGQGTTPQEARWIRVRTAQ